MQNVCCNRSDCRKDSHGRVPQAHTQEGAGGRQPLLGSLCQMGAAPGRQRLVTKLKTEWGQKEGLLTLMAS